jgi:S1-C subfamily serine protease
MKVLRPFVWAAVMVAAFLYVTSVARWDVGRLFRQGSDGPIWVGPANAAPGFSVDEQNNIDIYKQAREATVNITSVVYRENWFMQVYPEKGTGSGFLIKSTGEIITNNHVVSGSSQLTVTLSNKKVLKAKVLVTDPRNDLALIKIEPDHQISALRLGDSDGLIVGQKVLAIGNPFGFEGTLTTGIVSSLNRTIQTEETRELEGMIQTDAAINPGNSGGPLLDSHGNVIAINTAIFGPQGSIGLGFAMPINRAKAMLEEYQTKGKISRPSLGIQTVFVTGDLARLLELPEEGGLLVQRVDRGSAAEEAGLRRPRRTVIVENYPVGIGGDLIMEVDGVRVEGKETLQRVLNRKHGGDTIDFTVFRNGRKVNLKITLGEAVTVLG